MCTPNLYNITALIALLACIHPTVYGFPDRLPEIIEASDERTATCYGTHTHLRPTCAHRPGTVIGIQAVKVGAKRRTLNCPENVADSLLRNDTCCSPNTTQDCVQVYDYKNSGIDYKFHKYCSGYKECKDSVQTVHDYSRCDNSTTQVYLRFTNYMFMEYACINESRIGGLCSNETFNVSRTDSPFYIQSPKYPQSVYSPNLESCTCHIKAASHMSVYMLDMRLYGHTLDISDSSSLDIFDKTNATLFNVTLTNKTEESWITLDSTSNNDASYVWIGLEAIDRGPFTVSCKAFTTDSKDQPNSSTPNPSQSTGGEGPDIGVLHVAGIAIGLLLFIAFSILLLCYLCKRKNRKSDDKQKMAKEKDPNARDRVIYATENPRNEKFKPSRIPSNKVEPTRHIEEHGGLKTKPLPQISWQDTTQKTNPRLDIASAPTGHLPPINTLTALDENGERLSRDHKRKKKRKKHKRHKQKETLDTEIAGKPDMANFSAEITI